MSGEESGERRVLSLFEGFGIELEYMIVDAGTLDVKPIADRLIEAESGAIENEIERGPFAWSNELARHVIEVKTNGPVPGFAGVGDGFAAELRRIEALLAPMGARILPTAMHPWMDAARDFELWPHGSHEIYDAFHRIFDCRGHGWANLQSAHLNLPFANDDEFGRLHAAIRAILPILPALAASSPCVDGRISGFMDTRLDVYRSNARRVPSVSGSVVPEPVFTRADYQGLLSSIYADIAPLDPEGLLQHEWLNARGAIARFDRMALEIRVLDVQETPAADVAIHAAITASLRALCRMDAAGQARLRALDTRALAEILRATTKEAERADVVDGDYLAALGFDRQARRASDLWCELLERDFAEDPLYRALRGPLDVIRDEGTLSTRILQRLRRQSGSRSGPTGSPSRDHLTAVWRELADCLREGRMLRAER
ncbi:MAG: glutamate--cysteine ligase [Deltaproteobacteria bacterium]|nr:glutamate--cysteine ligase [Deltaproteobacteria bacterium]